MYDNTMSTEYDEYRYKPLTSLTCEMCGVIGALSTSAYFKNGKNICGKCMRIIMNLEMQGLNTEDKLI